jgi:hypothetical protein
MRKALFAAACLGALTATPAAAQQRTPTAHCYDGTYYYGASRRLACAHHRGVSEWLGPLSRSQLRSTTPRVRPQARKPTAPAGATARCRDGTWSKAPRRSGACVRHGGVARWLGPR